VILTPAGIITVRDKNDMYIQKTIDIVENEPDKTDEQKAAAVLIVKQGKYSLPGGGPEPFEKDPRDTIIREVGEELNLHVEPRNMQKLAEIVGETRRHVIYLVRATGMISLNPDESITGIGFLKQKNIFPLTHSFFQTHVIRLHGRYFNNIRREERDVRLIQFVSNIRVSKLLIDEWFDEERLAAIYRGKHRRSLIPHAIDSSPNLTILDHSGKPLPSPESSSLTKASTAVYIPRAPDPLLPGLVKTLTKKPSDPNMKAIQAPSTDTIPESGVSQPVETIEVEDYSKLTKEKSSGQK